MFGWNAKRGGKVVSINAIDQKVEIVYPVRWSYRLVGRDMQALAACVARIMGERDHTVALSNKSSSGKFVSYACELLVMNEDERLFFYEEFRKDEAVMYLL